MKLGILLRSIRLTRVTCICAVSEEVFSQARLSQTGVTATYYPAAGAVMFERAKHEPHIVLNHLIVDMVADDKEDWNRWLAPAGWDYTEIQEGVPPPEPATEIQEGVPPWPTPAPKAKAKLKAKAAKKGRPKSRVR